MSSERLELAKETLKALVAIPSVNPACLKSAGREDDGITGESRISKWLMDWAAGHGLSCRDFEAAPGRPCAIIELPADAPAPDGAKTIACFAHADTVWTPAIDKPFELKEKDGELWGLGAADDKASIAAGLLALLSLKSKSGRKSNFVLACTADEESGFLGIRRLVPEVLKPDAAVVCEGTSLNVVAAHKGLIRWDLTTRGEAAHASLLPKGKNAIYAAARLALTMESHCAELMKGPRHQSLGTATLNVGVIKGGTQANSVPDLCSFTLERRLLPGEDLQAAESSIRKALEAAGEPFALSDPYSGVEAFEIPREHPWVSIVLEEAKKLKPNAKIESMTCATEAAQTGLCGIPTVVFGPGSLSTAHSKDERVAPEEILNAADALAALPFLDLPF